MTRLTQKQKAIGIIKDCLIELEYQEKAIKIQLDKGFAHEKALSQTLEKIKSEMNLLKTIINKMERI